MNEPQGNSARGGGHAIVAGRFWEGEQLQTFALERDQLVVVGRHSPCQIVIPFTSVSRQHLDLQWDGCRVLVRDLHTRGGSYLNNRQICGNNGDVLRPGDTIRIVDARLRLRVPIAVEPPWLAWNDSTVYKIAQAIDADAAFDRVPILADALEDAGCDNADILNHCREPSEHVRGCWVVDLLLGKE